jgi:hypothetical protein
MLACGLLHSLAHVNADKASQVVSKALRGPLFAAILSAVPGGSKERGRPMESEEVRELRATLLKLKQEHRDLDSAINALEETGRADALQLKRLKKKKLYLKDEIARIEDQLLPDIIA